MLGSLFGGAADKTVGTLVTSVGSVLDELFTSDEEREQAKLKLMELQQRGKLAQLAVNLKEAAHPSVFVSGWRPAVGWICASAMAYHFVIQPFMAFAAWAVAAAVDKQIPLELLPTLDIGSLLTVLGGMLGLGTMRTVEKRKGVARD